MYLPAHQSKKSLLGNRRDQPQKCCKSQVNDLLGFYEEEEAKQESRMFQRPAYLNQIKDKAPAQSHLDLGKKNEPVTKFGDFQMRSKQMIGEQKSQVEMIQNRKPSNLLKRKSKFSNRKSETLKQVTTS